MCLFYRHYYCCFCCCCFCLVFFLLSKITSFVFCSLRVLHSRCLRILFGYHFCWGSFLVCLISFTVYALLNAFVLLLHLLHWSLHQPNIMQREHKHNTIHKCTAIVCRFESLTLAHSARATMFPLFVYTVLEMKETTESMLLLLLLLLPCITVYLCHERKIIHNTILNRSYAKQMQKRFLDVLV